MNTYKLTWKCRILNDLGVNIITETWPQILAECGAPGRFAAIVGLKTKKRQPGCRTPNTGVSKKQSTPKRTVRPGKKEGSRLVSDFASYQELARDRQG